MTATQMIDKPAPASGETPDAVRVWLRFVRLQQRLSNGIAAELRAIGLSIPQFDLISTLSEREGITQGELAQRLYVTKGNVSGLVDRLVEAELVERRPIPGDRRSHALHLTSAGRERAREGIAAQRAFVARTLGRLPGEDVVELERILRAWRDVARETL
ncbi:MarR family winged helix-turn-helix transcriptional regulator [Salinarimonas chemoclinalis]|uniref:MarR family winged helix-turn-helix transcriptional regulator n=1 Tax=Salinarimonas chemoclinalis TaxID=3241599 RepID=UPI003556BD8F